MSNANDDLIVYTLEERQFLLIKALAARLCSGSDKMRDEGNLLTYLLSYAVKQIIQE